MSKITKRLVDTLEPEEKEYFVWDSEIKGFGIRMMPTGLASYIIKYRNSEGRQRKFVLGRVGTLTPEQARKMARVKLADVSQGGDPSSERQNIRKAITVAELCDIYSEETKGRLKESSHKMDVSRMNTHVKPLIGKRTVRSLTVTDLTKMMNDIIAGKTAKPRKGRGGITTGGERIAGSTVVMLGTMLEFARKRGIVDRNVARDVRRPKDKKRERFLSFEEIKRLGVVMRDDISETVNPIPLAAIRFALLTGYRRNEVLSLRWKYLDEENGCARLEDTKTGYQIRPIGVSAFAVLKDLPQSSEWVFPATHGDGHFVGLPKALARLCERAGLKDVSIHTLRHSFATTAVTMGFSELVIGGMIGHKSSSITARYAHVPDRTLVDVANQLSIKIAQLLDGEE